jgi:hypothetical protein
MTLSKDGQFAFEGDTASLTARVPQRVSAKTPRRSGHYVLEDSTRVVLMSLIAERYPANGPLSWPLVPNSTVLFIDDLLCVADRVVTQLSKEMHADILDVNLSGLGSLARAIDDHASNQPGFPLLALVRAGSLEMDHETVELIECLMDRFHRHHDLGILFVAISRNMIDPTFAAHFDLVLSLWPHKVNGAAV